jgi:ATP-dependent helicase/nuclease subunit B
MSSDSLGVTGGAQSSGMSVLLNARIDFAQPGREALNWLRQTVAELKAGDALAPVTIVPPTMAAGRVTLRELAHRDGYVNTSARRLDDVAAELARPLLGGRRTLTPVVELAAARCAARSVERLRPLADHLALSQALVSLFRELRRSEVEPDLSAWSEASAMAQAAIEAYRRFGELTGAYVDPTRVRDLAREALRGAVAEGQDGGTQSRPVPSGVGALVLFLPTRLDPADVGLLAALADHAPLRALFPYL